jgi:hypothetical protein
MTDSTLWLPRSYVESLSRGNGPLPDLAPFVRANLSLATLGRCTQAFENWAVLQAHQGVDPSLVPLSALRAMGNHTIVALAEHTIGGIMRRPDLYYVRHKDKAIVRETEEWLWPLLTKVLPTAVRAFAYGTVPAILDWGRADLRFEVPSEQDGVSHMTLVGHTHFVDSHEVWPSDVEVELDGTRLVALRHGGRRYLADRVCLFVWDPEFGELMGQGARRRAWRDYVASLIVGALQAGYLERSVDSPRVLFTPPGTHNVGGQEVSTGEYVGQQFQLLRGSGSIALPSTRDGGGHKRYELTTLDVPDRKDVWEQALNRYDGGILKAYLVPPSLAGVEDLAATGAKVLDGMLREFIQNLAQFAANHLNAVVRTVHAINHDPEKLRPPEILAYEVPAAIRKLYLDVLRVVNAADHGESAAAWVDVPALLDQLGVPLRTSPLRVERASNPIGRPRDASGEREERREDARTPEGEDAVGAPDEQDE